MKASGELHGERLSRYERELAELKSFLKELKARTAELGTPTEHYEQDVSEAEHNIRFYEDEIARIKKEGGGTGGAGGGRPGGGGDSILPQTAKQGLGSLIVSSVSFLAGILIGSSLSSRRGDRDRGEGS